ncbi:MAG: autotransporter outer membrane beta-barrel domain-containing protein [Deltaproteobacteria bacterium]|nr:autotransporter outer membrane beta-barrel domain-containing protein [Deltaproteobacteria bacterium]
MTDSPGKRRGQRGIEDSDDGYFFWVLLHPEIKNRDLKGTCVGQGFSSTKARRRSRKLNNPFSVGCFPIGGQAMIFQNGFFLIIEVEMRHFLKKRQSRIFKKSKSMLFASVFLLFFSHAGLVRGGDFSITGADTWSYPRSRIPEPTTPMFSVITNFTNYSASTFPCVTNGFYVTQTGYYTANLQSTIANGIYISLGRFVPSATSDPSTPLSDVMMFLQSGNTTTLSNIELEAGTRYSYILVFNASSSASFEFTLTGLGDIFQLGTEEAKFLTHLLPAVRDVLNTSGHLISQRQDLHRGLVSGDDFLGNGSLWMKPFGSWADQGSRNGVAGYRADTKGLAIGMDRDVAASLNIGGAFMYARSDIDSDDNGAKQSTDVDLYQAVAYGSYSFDDRAFVDFHVGLGRHKNEGYRQIVFLPISASSDYDGRSYHLGAVLGRIFPLARQTRFVPSVRADYIWIKNDGYREKGAGSENMIVKRDRAEAFIIGIDGKLIHQLNARISLIGSLGFGYDTVNNRDRVTTSFEGSPDDTFITYGIKPKPWLGCAGLGAIYKIKDSFDFNARYDVDYRERFFNQTASVNVRWIF